MENINRMAREYFLQGTKDVGVMVVHGFTSSPSYMRGVCNDLNAMGYSVFAPLLAGHGMSEDQLCKYNGKDWYESVKQGAAQLRQSGVKKVFAMGHSLGGLLSLKLAQQDEVDGVIAVAAPIKLRHSYRTKLFAALFKKSYYTMNKPDGNPEMFRYYRADGTSISNLISVIKDVRTNLSKVKAPGFFIVSREDGTVDFRSGQILYDQVSSKVKRLVAITGNHHQCITDSKGQYIEEVGIFIEQNS